VTPVSRSDPIVRRATSADLPRIGRLGALLIEEHHDFDSRRFLATRGRTPVDYASFISTQLEDPDVAVLVADHNGEVIGYAYAAVEGYEPRRWLRNRQRRRRLDGDQAQWPMSHASRTAAAPWRRGDGQERLLLRARERLDPMLFLEGTTPGEKPPLPDQDHGQARTRVPRGLPQSVPFQPPHKVLGDAGVERPVAAAKDVDEGQRYQHTIIRAPAANDGRHSSRFRKGGTMSEEDMKAEVARLKEENERLKARQSRAISLKVSEKGGLSVYGLGRFPVTLYKEQWTKLLDMADDIRAFLKENDSRLKSKS
jgi:hypothetical protein